MPLLDLQKLSAGLSRTWAGFLRDWDRSLRSGNYPETTRYNYLLATAQLARYLGEYSPDPDADDAADDPCVVTRAHAEAFQAWMIETRSASTASSPCNASTQKPARRNDPLRRTPTPAETARLPDRHLPCLRNPLGCHYSAKPVTWAMSDTSPAMACWS